MLGFRKGDKGKWKQRLNPKIERQHFIRHFISSFPFLACMYLCGYIWCVGLGLHIVFRSIIKKSKNFSSNKKYHTLKSHGEPQRKYSYFTPLWPDLHLGLVFEGSWCTWLFMCMTERTCHLYKTLLPEISPPTSAWERPPGELTWSPSRPFCILTFLRKHLPGQGWVWNSLANVLLRLFIHHCIEAKMYFQLFTISLL